MKQYQFLNNLLTIRILIIVLTVFSITQTLFASDELVTVSTPSDLSVQPSQELVLSITLTIKKDWHINAHKPLLEFLIPTEISFESVAGIEVTSIVYPEPHKITLEFLDEPLLVYDNTVSVPVTILIAPDCVPGQKNLTGMLTYQGCDNKSCRPPVSKEFSINVLVTGAQSPSGSVEPEMKEIEQPSIPATPATSEDRGDSRGLTSGEQQAQDVIEKGLFYALLTFFLAGLALNLTPCVYPVIPITISFFSSQGGDGKGSRLAIAISYTLGIAVVFTILGLVSSLAGQQWGFLFQHPWFVIVISIFMLAMAASMFGAFEIKIPSSLMTKLGQSREGIVGALFMGATVGIVIAPCAAGPIIGLITLVAKQGLVFQGSLLFFFMGLGLGLPYLLLATFSSFLTKMPRSGMWMVWIRKFFGIALIGVALYFVVPQAERVINQKLFYIGLTTLFGGLYLGFLEQDHGYSKVFNWGRAVFGLALVVIGFMFVQHTIAESEGFGTHKKSPVSWIYYNGQDTDEFFDKKKPVIIDFYADWCAPCRSMDQNTFTDPAVVELAVNFTMVKVDSTKSSPEIKKIMKQYSVSGLPAIVFLKSDGTEIAHLRVLQYTGPEAMLKKMNTLLD